MVIRNVVIQEMDIPNEYHLSVSHGTIVPQNWGMPFYAEDADTEEGYDVYSVNILVVL